MVAPAEVAPATQNQGNGQSTVISRIDVAGNMMSLVNGTEGTVRNIQEIGKMLAESRMLKLKNAQQGAAVVLAAICEGITPFQLTKEYHVMDDGGMSMKADVMLAKFNQAGGKHFWINTGDDGQETILRLVWNGQDIQVSYTIEDAKRAGLIRKGGNWEKNPGEMLRARATSKGVRMVAPGIVAGIYCPEDFPEQSPVQVSATVTSATTGGTRSRKAPATSAPTTTSNETADAVDAVVEKSQPTEVVPFEPGSAATATDDGIEVLETRDETTVLMEIEAHIIELGKTKEEIEAGMRAKNPSFKTIDDLPPEAQDKLLASLRAKVAQKNRTPF